MTKSSPQTVYDISQNYGQGLSYSATNDLQLCSGIERSKQRVLRRLFTTPVTGYIWHTNYGAGLSRFVGDADTINKTNQIESLIISQIFLEDSVAKSPAPKISFQSIESGIFVQIDYVESSSKQPVVLTFNIAN